MISSISFVLINLIMVVLPISYLRFYHTIQPGMFPATVIYVNAGSEISKVNNINDIMSFVLIASFFNSYSSDFDKVFNKLFYQAE